MGKQLVPVLADVIGVKGGLFPIVHLPGNRAQPQLLFPQLLQGHAGELLLGHAHRGRHAGVDVKDALVAPGDENIAEIAVQYLFRVACKLLRVFLDQRLESHRAPSKSHFSDTFVSDLIHSFKIETFHFQNRVTQKGRERKAFSRFFPLARRLLYDNGGNLPRKGVKTSKSPPCNLCESV